ncbi:Sec-independent protein translocase protein TatB [Qipengyuania seohaensis]|uniref:Sec-independent protein translocase protein TatB n=1 Tax=Qipengyuania seohaensis TaxID=266951 RepID=UPI000C2296D2|nr:Sec-independent protein translocase protein TatB [Qipengyuania seohaensis]
MFDIGAAELLLIVVVAIIVIGPKEMPRAMRTAGRWIGKLRRMSAHFRSGIDEMVRQAEIEDMEKKWADRNAEIMAKYPTGSEAAGGGPEIHPGAEMQPLAGAEEAPDADAAAEAAIKRAAPRKAPEHGGSDDSEPGLPLGDPPAPPPVRDAD